MSKRRSHPLYATWKQMRQRCNSTTHPAYVNYGARGITVCDRWNDFWLFVEDMGERPDGHTLDRIKNDEGYSPENCRWSSRLTQQTNRRAGNYIRTTPEGFRVCITLRPYLVHTRHFPVLELAKDYLSEVIAERAMYRELVHI